MDVPSIMGKPFMGAVVANDTVAHAGPFNSIYVVTAAVFSAWSEGGLTGTMTGLTFPAGTWIYGNIQSFTLTSGTVRAHKV